MVNPNINGTVFNIQHYAIHDGPGIRTTVFLNGCPLKCFWCQNPESGYSHPVLFYYAERCTGCGECISACPQNAIQLTGASSLTDRHLCDNCGECVTRCPNGARSLMGEILSAAAVFEDVAKDAIFYQSSQGGVTISGGDPVAQPEFVYELSRLCHEAGIHVALETSGFARWETITYVMTHADLVLYDFKHMDAGFHKTYTGVDNQRILENARRIYHELKKPLYARVPIIPGYNDTIENIRELTAFLVAELGKDVEVHLLPYHHLGRSKYTQLDIPLPPDDIKPPTDEHIKTLLSIIEEAELVGQIGG